MNRTADSSPILGRFWLPEAGEGTAIHGAMTFGDEGATVYLHDAISPDGLLNDETVFARLQGGREKATLTNCFAHARRRFDGTVDSSELSSTLVALGSMRDDLGGNAIQFRLEGAHRWFNELCFETDRKILPEATITFKREESFGYELPGGLKLERFYSSMVPLGGWGQEEIGILRPMQFCVSTPERLGIDELWELLQRTKEFFEFMSQNHLRHSGVHLYDEAEPTSRRPDVDILESSFLGRRPRKFQWQSQLVQFDEVQSSFPSLLYHWFDVQKSHPEPFSRYFAALDNDRNDPVLHFLWNVAALEELHKLRTTRNQRNLHLLSRLKDVRTRWSSATKKQVSDEVLKEIADTRHYYAHAAGDLRDRAATDWKLLRYGDFVAALSSLEILSLLGLSDGEVIRITNQFWLRETLALRKYPAGN